MKRVTRSRLNPWGHSAPPSPTPSPSPSPAAAGDGRAEWPHGVSHSRPEAAASAATTADADAPLPAPALSQQLPPAAASGDGAAYGAGEASRMPPSLDTVLPEEGRGGSARQC